MAWSQLPVLMPILALGMARTRTKAVTIVNVLPLTLLGTMAVLAAGADTYMSGHGEATNRTPRKLLLTAALLPLLAGVSTGIAEGNGTGWKTAGAGYLASLILVPLVAMSPLGYSAPKLHLRLQLPPHNPGPSTRRTSVMTLEAAF